MLLHCCDGLIVDLIFLSADIRILQCSPMYNRKALNYRMVNRHVQVSGSEWLKKLVPIRSPDFVVVWVRICIDFLMRIRFNRINRHWIYSPEMHFFVALNAVLHGFMSCIPAIVDAIIERGINLRWDWTLPSDPLQCKRSNNGKWQSKPLTVNRIDHVFIHDKCRRQRQRKIREIASENISLWSIHEIFSGWTVSKYVCDWFHMKLVRQKRVELLAACLEGRYSSQLSYWRMKLSISGTRTRIWTETRHSSSAIRIISSAVLPLHYSGMKWYSRWESNPQKPTV